MVNDKKHLEGVEKALRNYHEKQLPKKKKTRRKPNKKPEQELVKSLISYCRAHKIDVQVVESQNVYSQTSGKYTRAQTRAGTPDLIGNDRSGLSVWIEAKAPGRLSTLRENQREFLERKIRSNCFAVVVDSVERLNSLYYNFLKFNNRKQAQEYLLFQLPRPKKAVPDQPLFEE